MVQDFGECARHELRISPPSFLGLDEHHKEDTAGRLRDALDQRYLKLPSLEEHNHRTTIDHDEEPLLLACGFLRTEASDT